MGPTDFEITGLVISPLRRFEGRPADGIAPFDGDEHPQTVRVRAHKGFVGDRYFGSKFTYATATFIAAEQVRWLEGELGTGPFDPLESRRNIVTTGIDVDALARHEFTIDAGHGPIRFRSITPANPCAWMNVVYADGAHQTLRGHAGIRAEPIDDGHISIGPATLSDVRALTDGELRRRITEAPVS